MFDPFFCLLESTSISFFHRLFLYLLLSRLDPTISYQSLCVLDFGVRSSVKAEGGRKEEEEEGEGGGTRSVLAGR